MQGPSRASKEWFIRDRAPKWGDEAAALGWRAEKVRRTMGIALALILLSFAAPSPAWPYLFGTGSLLAVAVVMLFGHTSAQMNRVASTTLGVEVGWRSAPPSHSPAYEEWCARLGLVPYAASDQYQSSNKSQDTEHSIQNDGSTVADQREIGDKP
jgi:hypothetical protein